MTTFPSPDLLPLPAPSGLPIADLYVRHLLAVTDDVEPSEIETLALSRFPVTAWETAPAEERTPDGVRLLPGVLRVSRHTVVSGPYAPRGEDGSTISFGRPVDMVYEVLCPRERGGAPYTGGGDRDGFARVFADGLPIREEWRLATWLVAVARRLGGSVRLEVDAERTAVLSPDPGVSVDVTIYSDVWLDPEAALAVCATANPGARLAGTGTRWQGPPPTAGLVPVLGDDALTADQLRALHERADEFDIAALSAPRTMSTYGVEVDLGEDGIVTVEVAGIDKPPTVLRGLDWAADGAITYLVRWTPDDLVDWQREVPSFDHKVARTRATGVVSRLSRVIFAAVGGEIADQDDFLLDPEDV